MRYYFLYIIIFTLFGIGAYTLGTSIPDRPTELVEQYDVDNENYNGTNFGPLGNTSLVGARRDDSISMQGRPSPYADSLSNFTYDGELPTGDTYQTGTAGTQIVGQNPQVPNTDNNSGSEKDVIGTADNTTVLNDQFPIAQDEIYKAKINPRISFPVPGGSSVVEKGTKRDPVFEIHDGSLVYTMLISQVEQGCFDPIMSFAISPSTGVDFRIINNQNDVTLTSSYQAKITDEEYGTYSGAYAQRTTACILTAVPTKFEIRSSSFARKEASESFAIFGRIIQGFKI